MPTAEQHANARIKRCRTVIPTPILRAVAWMPDVSEHVQAIRAVKECLKHDPDDEGSFLDESRFQRLLPALVSQLGAQAPPLTDAPTPPDSAPSTDTNAGTALMTASEASHQYAEGVKGALVALALKGGSDVRWKTLHRQVSASAQLSILSAGVEGHRDGGGAKAACSPSGCKLVSLVRHIGIIRTEARTCQACFLMSFDSRL